MLVPVETVAANSGGVTCVAVVDGQVQGDHTVTTIRIRECVRQVVAAGGDVSMLVPVEAVAGNGGRVARAAMVDGQVQGYHAIAAARVREGMRQVVAAGGDVSMLVPVEAVAGNGGRVARAAMVDGQVQGYHAIAAARVREGMRQVVAAGGDVSMLVPVEAVAGNSGRVARVAIVDGQV